MSSCALAIIALSLVPLASTLLVMSRGVVIRPLLSGIAAGVLSGALGGGAYAFICRNDGAVLVALWYGTAILVTTLIGALCDARILRW